jgi:hypothetical protein
VMKQREVNKHPGPMRVMSVDAESAGFIVAIACLCSPLLEIPASKNCGNLTASPLHKGARDRTHRADQDGEARKSRDAAVQPFQCIGLGCCC